MFLFNYHHTKQAAFKRFDTTTGMLHIKTYLDNAVSQRSPSLYDQIYKFLCYLQTILKLHST